MSEPLYLDCHSTTPVADEVLSCMLPWFADQFGNAGSHSHRWGEQAREAVDNARDQLAKAVGVSSDELVFTSGATESNNLAILGVADRLQRRKNSMVSLAIEHPSVIAPLQRLQRDGWSIGWAEVQSQGQPGAGQVSLPHLESLLTEETALVSIALANNEIGVVQPVQQIVELAHSVGAWVHLDVSQAVGWLPIALHQWQVDLASFSAHKFYGPKGVGALFVRSAETWNGARPVRLSPRQIGGGQEMGLRSGTLNVPGIVGMGAAAELAASEQPVQQARVQGLRDQLWDALQVSGCFQLNGPILEQGRRLPNNLNFRVDGVEGQSLMARLPHLAMSSGSACSSAEPGVSQVLTGIGMTEDQARCSLRIGLGRMHQEADLMRVASDLIQVAREFLGKTA